MTPPRALPRHREREQTETGPAGGFPRVRTVEGPRKRGLPRTLTERLRSETPHPPHLRALLGGVAAAVCGAVPGGGAELLDRGHLDAHRAPAGRGRVRRTNYLAVARGRIGVWRGMLSVATDGLDEAIRRLTLHNAVPPGDVHLPSAGGLWGVSDSRPSLSPAAAPWAWWSPCGLSSPAAPCCPSQPLPGRCAGVPQDVVPPSASAPHAATTSPDRCPECGRFAGTRGT